LTDALNIQRGSVGQKTELMEQVILIDTLEKNISEENMRKDDKEHKTEIEDLKT
jgi:hypothetical protein